MTVTAIDAESALVYVIVTMATDTRIRRLPGIPQRAAVTVETGCIRVTPKQCEVCLRRMVETHTGPSRRGVAAFAAVFENARMCAGIAMALDALLRRRVEAATQVTLGAGQAPVQAVDCKRREVMVVRVLFPGRVHFVAFATGSAERARVDIILFMAIRALRTNLARLRRFVRVVARRTRHLDVDTPQLVLRRVVIEPVIAPSFAAVTRRTFLSESALMHIVLRVTRHARVIPQASSREKRCERLVPHRVTRRAFDAGVCCAQGKSSLVVRESPFGPRRGRVAALAPRAEHPQVCVVRFVTITAACGRGKLEVHVACTAKHLPMRPREWKLGGTMIECR